MTPKEANKILEMFLHKQCDLKRTEFAYNQNEVYQAVDMANSALEKQIPKKPTPQVVKGGKRLIGNGWWCKGTTVYKCPCCNSWITQTYKYCIDCGQAILWGDCE